MEALLVDLDGTLVSFNIDFIEARRVALKELKKFNINTEEFSEKESLYMILKKLKNHVNMRTYLKLRDVFWAILEKYEIKAAKNTEIHPEVIDTLEKIKNAGKKIAIVTNNGRIGTNIILKRFDLKKFFDIIITREDTNELKPDSGGILKALKILRINSNNAVYLGDGVIDVKASQKAGIPSVAIPSGISSLKNLIKSNPDFFISSFSDILILLHI